MGRGALTYEVRGAGRVVPRRQLTGRAGEGYKDIGVLLR